MNYGFIIDNRKCIGCHACTVACKAEHDVPIGVNRTWVKYIEKGEYPNSRRLFSVMRCNHCADAPCVEICPVEALHIRDDGIVDFDNRRCIGCKACTQACPYDALYIDPNTYTAAKCNYCAHRIDIGLEPACVNVCPEHAIISGNLDDPESEISLLLSREQVTARKVEKGTRPKLFYIDGDESSLIPSKTDKSTDYMWNSQTTGVGHYAKYAEKLVARADPLSMVQQLSGSGNGRRVDAGNVDSERVMVPKGENQQKMLQKAMEVFKETTRRVYDAPGKGVLWGWEVSAYVSTKAVSAGSFLVIFLALVSGLTPVSEGTQWLGIGFSLLFLALTGGLLVKDLDKPTRFTYVLMRPQWKSWLVRGGYSITFLGGFVTLWGVVKYFGWQALEPVALWGSAIFGVITAVYTAFLFAQARGRDFWQSPALSLHMLGHSVIAGAAALAIFAPLMGAEESWLNYLRMVFYAGIIFNLVIILAEIITTHPTSDAKQTVKMIVSGRFSTQFWFGAIILGNIFPLLLVAFGGNTLLPLTGVAVLIGMYVTEHIWVRAPQLIPLS
jgi:Fe-S-cluster-containing dehydrogenase component/formate-dependent nitrite reductase membrane component NrfD